MDGLTARIQRLANERGITFIEAARLMGQRGAQLKRRKLTGSQARKYNDEQFKKFEQMKQARPDLYD